MPHVNPSELPYTKLDAWGNPIMKMEPFWMKDAGLREKMTAGGRFDQFLSESVLPKIGGLSTQDTSLLNMSSVLGVPFSGKPDILYKSGPDGKINVIEDIKYGSAVIHGGDQAFYSDQLLSYALALKSQGRLAENFTIRIRQISRDWVEKNNIQQNFRPGQEQALWNTLTSMPDNSPMGQVWQRTMSATTDLEVEAKRLQPVYEHIYGFKTAVERATGYEYKAVGQSQVEAGLEDTAKEHFGPIIEYVTQVATALQSGLITEEQAKRFVATRTAGTGLDPQKYLRKKGIGTTDVIGESGLGTTTLLPGYKEQQLSQFGQVIQTGREFAITGGKQDELLAYRGVAEVCEAGLLINNTLVIPDFDTRNATGQFFQDVAGKAKKAFNKANGGEAGRIAANQEVRASLEGNPVLGRQWRTMVMPALVEKYKGMIKINVGSQAPQEFFPKLPQGYVARGTNPSQAFDLAKVVQGIPGATIDAQGNIYMGMSATAKLPKTVQLGSRSELIFPTLTAAGRQSTRMSVLAMNQTPAPIGIAARTAVGSVMPEGMQAFDTGWLTRMGKGTQRFDDWIELGEGQTFNPAATFNEEGPMGFKIGDTNHGPIDYRHPTWGGEYTVSQAVNEFRGGKRGIRVSGELHVAGEGGDWKLWATSGKGMGVGMDLAQMMGNDAVDILTSLPKNKRMFGFGVIAGEYARDDDAFRLAQDLISAGAPEAVVMRALRDPSAVERGLGAQMNVGVPGAILSWSHELDEHMYDLARNILEKGMDKGNEYSLAVTKEDYLLLQAGYGDALEDISKSGKQVLLDRGEAVNVKLRVPTPIMQMFNFIGMERQGTSSFTLQTMVDILKNPGRFGGRYSEMAGKMFNQLWREGGHTRGPYEAVIRSRLANEGVISETELGGVMGLDELRASWKTSGNTGDFVSWLAGITTSEKDGQKTHRYIKIGDRQYLPPGEFLRAFSVDNELYKMLENPYEDDEEKKRIKLTPENMSPIIAALKKLVSTPNYQTATTEALTGKLFSDDPAALGVFTQFSRHGGIAEGATKTAVQGIEKAYTSLLGMKVGEVLMGDEVLSKLLPGLSIDEINEQLGSRSAIVAFQRQPSANPTQTSVRFGKILTASQYNKRMTGAGGTTIATGTGMIAFSQFDMNEMQGDADADRAVAAILSRVFEGKISSDPSLRQFAGTTEWLQRSKRAFETMLGRRLPDNFTLDDYFTTALQTGNMSEVSKLVGKLQDFSLALKADPLSAYLGTKTDWMASVSMGSARKEYENQARAKGQMGSVFNRFSRELGMVASGMGEDSFQMAQRLSGFAYQNAVDMKLASKGMGKLMAITETLRLFGEGKNVTNKFEPLEGSELPRFSAHFGENWTMKELATTIMSSIIEMPELKGVRHDDNLEEMASYAKDVALAITMNSKVYDAVVKGVLSGTADADKIWEEFGGSDEERTANFLGSLGPLAASVMARPFARAFDKGNVFSKSSMRSMIEKYDKVGFKDFTRLAEGPVSGLIKMGRAQRATKNILGHEGGSDLAEDMGAAILPIEVMQRAAGFQEARKFNKGDSFNDALVFAEGKSSPLEEHLRFLGTKNQAEILKYLDSQGMDAKDVQDVVKMVRGLAGSIGMDPNAPITKVLEVLKINEITPMSGGSLADQLKYVMSSGVANYIKAGSTPPQMGSALGYGETRQGSTRVSGGTTQQAGYGKQPLNLGKDYGGAMGRLIQGQYKDMPSPEFFEMTQQMFEKGGLTSTGQGLLLRTFGGGSEQQAVKAQGLAVLGGEGTLSAAAMGRQMVGQTKLDQLEKAASKVAESFELISKHAPEFAKVIKEATSDIKSGSDTKAGFNIISKAMGAVLEGQEAGVDISKMAGFKQFQQLMPGFKDAQEAMFDRQLKGPGIGERAGGLFHQMTSGFELFRLQRLYEMGMGSVIEKQIPMAAQGSLETWQIARGLGGVGVGGLGGTLAGGVIGAQTRMQLAQERAGKVGYELYGPAMEMGGGILPSIGAAIAPIAMTTALGGYFGGLAGGVLGSSFGPIGTAIGAGVGFAATAGMAAIGSIKAAQDPNAANQLKWARQAAAQPAVPKEFNLGGAMKEGASSYYAGAPSGSYMPPKSLVTPEAAAQVGLPLGKMDPKFLQSDIEEIRTALAPQYGGTENFRAIMEQASVFDQDLMKLDKDEIIKQGGTALMKQIRASGVSIGAYEGVSQAYRLGIGGTAQVAQIMNQTGMTDATRYQMGQKLGQYAPLVQMGMSLTQAAARPALTGQQAYAVQSIASGGPAQEVLNREGQQWQLATQQRVTQRDFDYQTGQFKTQTQQIQAQRGQQDIQLGLQARGIAQNQSQFMQQWAITDPAFYRQQAWQRQDLTREYGRGQTQFGWQERELGISTARSNRQMDWQIQDLGINKARSDIQFGWGRQDIARQGQMGGLQFQWGMQDIDEQMRYSTGRERRQLSRQRERQVIQFGFAQEGLGIESQRLEEKKGWSDADFAREKGRAGERRGWIAADFTREMEQLATRRGWLDEDFVRNQGRMETTFADETALHILQLKNRGEDNDLALAGLKAQFDQLTINRPLEDKARADEWTHILAVKKEADDQLKWDTGRVKQYNELYDTLNLTDAKIVALGTGFNSMVDSIKDYVFKTMLEFGGVDMSAVSGGGGGQGDR